MASGYHEYLLQLVPTWLRGPLGGAWMESHGLVLDGLVEGARQAIRARFVPTAPVDALPLLASERQLERQPPDSESSWRARLLGAWETWGWVGTKRGIRDAVLATGYFAHAPVYNHLQWPAGPDASAGWDEFWVVVSGHPWVSEGDWDDPGDWDDGGTWDTTASPDEVDRVLRQVRLFKPADARCAGVVVLLDGSLWPDGPSPPSLVSGTFTNWFVE